MESIGLETGDEIETRDVRLELPPGILVGEHDMSSLSSCVDLRIVLEYEGLLSWLLLPMSVLVGLTLPSTFAGFSE
jgi:hypothetical protein